MAPGVGNVLRPVGFKVVRVDVTTGTSEDFAVNKGRTSGTSLYVVDFGVMTTTLRGPCRGQARVCCGALPGRASNETSLLARLDTRVANNPALQGAVELNV